MMGVPDLPQRVVDVLYAAGRLYETVPEVIAVGLAGSWARGAGRSDSDVDLVVLTTAVTDMLARTDWFATFDPAAELIRSSDFGAIQERRLLLPGATAVVVSGSGRTLALIEHVC